MPTVLTKNGNKYYFYSNDHEPMHMHVKRSSGKAKFDMSDGVKLIESRGMSIPELNDAQSTIEENIEMMRRKWHEFFK